ncbi:MAG: hypothetical protein CMJ38_01120 [Phycisphaerae bacterium]|nr:hypothetical protein [Phycisphaerae bacterium]
MNLLLAIVISLSTTDRLESVLDAAGDNKSELQAVLDHYESQGEMQKYEATCFLIENMEGHNYTELVFFNEKDEIVPFDSLSYENYDEAASAMHSLEQEHGSIRHGKGKVIHDIETITSEYLIENIDLAFAAWHTNPWAKHLSFDDFCEYVLPYRGSNEPIESWRGELMDNFASLEDELEDSSNPFEAGKLLEQKANAIIGFDPIFYLHPTDQGFAEMKERGLGRCEDITNMQIYARRAGGVAVASDYTPLWAKAGNNHAWSVIIGPDGKGYAPIHNVAAKVYRKTYSEQLDSLGAKLEEGEQAPRWLKGKYYKDVTTSYGKVSDITIPMQEYTDEKYGYICVFNSGSWGPIHWSNLEYGYAHFNDMGRDILYMPAYFRDGDVIETATPLILHNNGTVEKLAGGGDTASIMLTSTTGDEVTYEGMTDESVQLPIKEGVSYELFVWDDADWQTVATEFGGSAPFTFEGLDTKRLYWLTEIGGTKEERPFVISNGEVVRY